jgi:hypothetical protein
MPDEPVATRLLTVADLAARWTCGEALAWSKARENIPAVWLGRGKYRPGKAGPKVVRFRLAAVEAFEQGQELDLAPGRPPKPAQHRPIPGLWDGISRLRKVTTKPAARPTRSKPTRRP